MCMGVCKYVYTYACMCVYVYDIMIIIKCVGLYVCSAL